MAPEELQEPEEKIPSALEFARQGLAFDCLSGLVHTLERYQELAAGDKLYLENYVRMCMGELIKLQIKLHPIMSLSRFMENKESNCYYYVNPTSFFPGGYDIGRVQIGGLYGFYQNFLPQYKILFYTNPETHIGICAPEGLWEVIDGDYNFTDGKHAKHVPEDRNYFTNFSCIPSYPPSSLSRPSQQGWAWPSVPEGTIATLPDNNLSAELIDLGLPFGSRPF